MFFGSVTVDLPVAKQTLRGRTVRLQLHIGDCVYIVSDSIACVTLRGFGCGSLYLSSEGQLCNCLGSPPPRCFVQQGCVIPPCFHLVIRPSCAPVPASPGDHLSRLLSLVLSGDGSVLIHPPRNLRWFRVPVEEDRARTWGIHCT